MLLQSSAHKAGHSMPSCPTHSVFFVRFRFDLFIFYFFIVTACAVQHYHYATKRFSRTNCLYSCSIYFFRSLYKPPPPAPRPYTLRSRSLGHAGAYFLLQNDPTSLPLDGVLQSRRHRWNPRHIGRSLHSPDQS